MQTLRIWAMRTLVVVLITMVAAALAYAFLTMYVRPLDGVEGEILFEAARIREGRALYIDPLIGTSEYGLPPTRYYVLYLPVWSWLVSWLPAGSAPVAGRLIATCLWLGLLGTIAATAKPSSRNTAWLAVAFVAGTYVLILYGSSARPDSIAVCAAGLGLIISVKNGRSGFVAGCLFALAAWLKSNVIGLAAGAFLATLLADRKAAGLTILGALTVSIPIAVVLELVSHGAWITHLLASTVQPFSLSILIERLDGRLQFFAGLICLAAWCGVRRLDLPEARVGLTALTTSTIWTVVLLSKTGSASNYWMEPCVAAALLIAQAGPPRLGPIAAVLAVVQALWVGVATVRSSIEGIHDASARAALLARARTICGIGQNDVVLADEPGLELQLNNRVIATPYQFSYLARSGRFPIATWRQDVERPEIRCLAMRIDLLERPPSNNDAEVDAFPPAIREVLVRRFVLADQDTGWRIYRLRNTPETGATQPR